MARIQTVINDALNRVSNTAGMTYMLIESNRLRTRDVVGLSRVLREAADELDRALGIQGTNGPSA